MKRIVCYIVAAFAAAVLCRAEDTTALHARLERIVSGCEKLSGASVGISVLDLRSSRELADINSGTRLIPASNTKLITTGLAIKTLGADWRFGTEIAYCGEIKDSTLTGDIYIIGLGDPTIMGRDALADRDILKKWADIIHRSGIKTVKGRVIGDGRAWEGPAEQATWALDDIGYDYGAGGDALYFHNNCIEIEETPGMQPGDSVTLVQTYPETPWMTLDNHAVTGRKGSKPSLMLYTYPSSTYARMEGCYPVDRKPRSELFANKFPALTCAFYLAREIGAEGYAFVDMDGIVRPGKAKEKAADAEPLGRTESAPLRDIARETNRQSVNLYAEAMYRASGKTICGSAHYDSCRVAQGKALEAMGLDPESVNIVDGSGLSRRNYISPEFMTAFLKAMAAGEDGKVFMGTLSTPGEGTAWALLKDCPRKANFRLKSGSMSGVLCYSGYLLADNGQPLAAISIMINGAQAGRSSLQSAAMDPLLQEIADFFLYL